MLLTVDQQVMPTARQTPGWNGAVVLTGADGLRGMTVTFWDSLETLVASGRDAKMFLEAASAAGVDVGIERFEVVMDERPE